MILPALVALPVALGPLLRGCWDVWAQSLIHLTTAGGLVLWLLSRTLVGYIPLPSNRNLLWSATLAGLGTLSVFLSPVHALALPEWYIFLNALILFVIMTAVSKDDRQRIDQAIRASAWILMILAFYQRIQLGDGRPASALVNQNVYAGTVLLLLPLALERKDWLLTGGLLMNLLWSRSVGAWLGLSVALLVTQRGRSSAWSWAGVAVGVVCSVAIYNKLQSPEVLHRVEWWRAAAAMIYERPLIGFGPGAYAYVLPAVEGVAGPHTGYAHQYFLQTGAEYGIVFALIWFAGLWSCVVRGNSYKRFGALAVLTHSMWDWSLSMPANLWLLSYFAASSLTEESRGVNVRARHKLPLCFLLVCFGAFLCSRTWDLWMADRAKTRAIHALEEGDWRTARREGEAGALRVARDPSVQWILAQAGIQRSVSVEDPAGDLRAAAERLETAAHLNPYRARTWKDLAGVYRRLGEKERAEEALRRADGFHLRAGQGLEVTRAVR